MVSKAFRMGKVCLRLGVPVASQASSISNTANNTQSKVVSDRSSWKLLSNFEACQAVDLHSTPCALQCEDVQTRSERECCRIRVLRGCAKNPCVQRLRGERSNSVTR